MNTTETIDNLLAAHHANVENTLCKVNNWEKLHLLHRLYPYESQPLLSEFWMLRLAGITSWGQVCEQDGVVKWLDLVRYVEYLYLKHSADFPLLTIITIQELTKAIIRRRTAGFYADWRQRQ